MRFRSVIVASFALVLGACSVSPAQILRSDGGAPPTRTDGGAEVYLARDYAGDEEFFIVGQQVERFFFARRLTPDGEEVWERAFLLRAGERVLGIQSHDPNGARLVTATSTAVFTKNIIHPEQAVRTFAIEPDRSPGRLGDPGFTAYHHFASFDRATDAAGEHLDLRVHRTVADGTGPETFPFDLGDLAFRDPLVAFAGANGLWLSMIHGGAVWLTRYDLTARRFVDHGMGSPCGVTDHDLITDSLDAYLSIDCDDRIELRFASANGASSSIVVSTSPPHPGVRSQLAWNHADNVVAIVYWPIGQVAPIVRTFAPAFNAQGEFQLDTTSSRPGATPSSVDIAWLNPGVWGAGWSDDRALHFQLIRE